MGTSTLRLEHTLRAEQEVRKVLTLEQMLTVFRRTLRPERFTQEEERLEGDPEGIFWGQGAGESFRAVHGTWSREERTGRYYLDEAVGRPDPEGMLPVGLLQWEMEEPDEESERWFHQVVQALEEAQENLALFGHL